MTGVYPNVHARIRWTRRAPGAPPSITTTAIWLHGDRFHIRDEAGRAYSEIVGDVTEPRGFGLMPQTVEDFLETWTDPSAGPGETTDLYGDLTTGEGLVREPGRSWETAAAMIAPVAAQLLSIGRDQGLEPVGERYHLGRDCLEFETFREGADNGRGFRTSVRWLSCGPFVLLHEVSDAENAGLCTRREVIELAEGVVDDCEVRPPSR
ncbi:hypothetical protein AB0I28_30885 [Phytomonospora sp. NPDC050363]|uniref:hypothetical protein n=1 Tax=Phytomonospora sp. NPDC050363 TaxID=3155642 RepID=UPI0033FC279C